MIFSAGTLPTDCGRGGGDCSLFSLDGRALCRWQGFYFLFFFFFLLCLHFLCLDWISIDALCRRQGFQFSFIFLCLDWFSTDGVALCRRQCFRFLFFVFFCVWIVFLYCKVFFLHSMAFGQHFQTLVGKNYRNSL